MAIISEINPETAPASIQKIIADHLAEGHALTAEKRTLLHNAAAFNAVEAGSYALDDELQRLIGKRAADFFEYAISQTNGCLVCSIYFRNLLKKNGIDFDTFEFTEKEQILIDYGQAIAENPKHVPQELFDKLKANFTEEEIVVITAMGVMMIANNYFNDILGVTPDKLVSSRYWAAAGPARPPCCGASAFCKRPTAAPSGLMTLKRILQSFAIMRSVPCG